MSYFAVVAAATADVVVVGLHIVDRVACMDVELFLDKYMLRRSVARVVVLRRGSRSNKGKSYFSTFISIFECYSMLALRLRCEFMQKIINRSSTKMPAFVAKFYLFFPFLDEILSSLQSSIDFNHFHFYMCRNSQTYLNSWSSLSKLTTKYLLGE